MSPLIFIGISNYTLFIDFRIFKGAGMMVGRGFTMGNFGVDTVMGNYTGKVMSYKVNVFSTPALLFSLICHNQSLLPPLF